MNVREWALPVYTILMQLAIGALFFLWIIRATNIRHIGEKAMDRMLKRPLLIVFITLIVAIIGSHFHLSNPLLSPLAVLNFRNSWLSREVFFTMATVLTVAALLDLFWIHDGHQRLKTWLGFGAVLCGFASIFCMSSIYLLPTQSPWNTGFTIVMFFGSALLLGVTATAAFLVMDAIFTNSLEPEISGVRQEVLNRSAYWIIGGVGVATAMIIISNIAQIQIIRSGSPMEQTSQTLMLGLYRPLLGVRFAALLSGVSCLTLAVYWMKQRGKSLNELIIPVYLACLLCLIAEILGRFLFYATHVRIGI